MQEAIATDLKAEFDKEEISCKFIRDGGNEIIGISCWGWQGKRLTVVNIGASEDLLIAFIFVHENYNPAMKEGNKPEVTRKEALLYDEQQMLAFIEDVKRLVQ